MPNGTVGTAYSQTLTATGDTPSTWSIDTGSLPSGLTISTTGVISGTPDTAVTYNFTVQATNAKGNNTKTLSIVIVPWTWTALSDSTFGTSNNNIFSIAYGIADGESVGRFVAVGASGKMAYSEDGASWKAVANSTFGNSDIWGIAYGKADGASVGRFVAVGDSDRMAYADW